MEWVLNPPHMGICEFIGGFLYLGYTVDVEKLYGLAQNTMKFHGIPQNTTEYHVSIRSVVRPQQIRAYLKNKKCTDY